MIQDDSFKVAWIDLTRGDVKIRHMEGGVIDKFVGGKGLAAHILYCHLPAGVDPLGPENMIALLTGPLTGTAFPASSRSVMAFKSPATGTFSDSYCGGRLGPYLCRGGLRGMVIRGKAAGPVYLLAEGETISIKAAGHLWGATTREAAKMLKNELGGSRLTVAAIGPAGENMAAMANVMNGRRAYGRGGLGAVWGSKNLKAVVVRDGIGVKPKDETGFKEQIGGIRKRLKENPMTRRGGAWNTFGTMMTLGVTQETGTLPTRNWRENSFDESESVQAEAFQPLLTGATACFSCPIACGRTAKVCVEGTEYITEGPEYETMYAFGPNCGIDDPKVLVAANDLCAKYGLDTISTGVSLSFAMECTEKGLLSEGIPSITSGDGRAVLKAIPAIAQNQSGYALLARGVKRASEAIPGSDALAIHVKGLELPGYDPRGMKGQALCYALADRGGCHLRSSTLGPELLGRPPGYDRLAYDGKADLIAQLQLEKIVFNMIPLCLFAGSEITIEDGAEAVSAVTGRNVTEENLLEAANRTRALIRLFNAREGFDRSDDTLPDRLFDEPSTRGHSCGETVDRAVFERLLTDYYAVVGWHPETGIPTAETVAKLGLHDAD
jgi:aldehyde:ferredoxin oxidoreductase